MLVTTLTASAAIVVTLWLGGAFNGLICGGDCGAAAVRTPDELNFIPADVAVEPSTEPTPELNAAAIQSAVEDPLDNDEELGERVGFAAVDARTGDAVAAVGSGALMPASTAKVLTAFTVLSKVDPQQRFTTSVVRAGNHLVLVGGGDPYLRSEPPEKKVFGVEADVETLAARTAAALRTAGIASVQAGLQRVQVQRSVVQSRLGGVVPGRRTSSRRSVRCGSTAGSTTACAPPSRPPPPPTRSPTRWRTSASTWPTITGPWPSRAAPTPVASVRSATVARITEEMMASSDNEAAEVLLRQAALAAGRPGSFADGVATVLEVLQANGIDTTGLSLHDGSGLSRRNRIAPVTLAQAIAKAAATPRTASLIADLPIANFSGTMDKRFGKEDDGRGVVRAKTGTLTDVHSLAGVVTDRLGTPIVFAVMADQAKDIPVRQRPRMPSMPWPQRWRGACARHVPWGHDRLGPRAQDRRAHGAARSGAVRRRGGRGRWPICVPPSAAAEEPVRTFTGLSPTPAAETPILVVDRARWVEANLASSRVLLEPVFTKLQKSDRAPSGLAKSVGESINGMEIGALLSFMSTKVLGQFDPFGSDPGRLLLVAPNIVHAERQLGRRPS